MLEFAGQANTTADETCGPVIDDVSVTPTSPPAVQFSAVSYNGSEAAGADDVTLTRPGGGPAGSVRIQAGGGSAQAGSDFTSLGTTTRVSFDAGQVSKTFTVPVLDDSADEPAETIGLSIDDPQGNAALGSPTTAVMTLADDDPAPDDGGGGDGGGGDDGGGGPAPPGPGPGPSPATRRPGRSSTS